MSSIKATYDSQGFVVVPGLISNSELPKLREASDQVINQTRAGKWPHRRTVGKQFPPFNNDNPDSWGVQHVMHPDLGDLAAVFSEWYTSDALTQVCSELLQCSEDNLQLGLSSLVRNFVAIDLSVDIYTIELFNLLINPLSHSFALRWHRDDVKETASPEEEQAALDQWHSGPMEYVSYGFTLEKLCVNIGNPRALYEDSCLFVVPGSHKVPRTPEQYQLSSTMDAPKDPMAMPGSVLLTLKPGETVFYNSNILHCASYDHMVKRATLHACTADSHTGGSRGRNILQHGMGWVKDARFRDQLNPKGQRMLDRLLDLQANTSEVQYSLEG